MYKPTYCCDCGEKVERLTWNILTNRRFCEFCETEHSLDSLISKVGIVMFSLFSLFGIGSYFSSLDRPVEIADTNATVNSEKRSERQGNVVTDPSEKEAASPVEEKSGSAVPQSADDIGANADRKSRASPVKDSPLQKYTSEPVYFCGAATKKGTPCSRRVKGGGRCWQHAGKEALLSEKELRIEP